MLSSSDHVVVVGAGLAGWRFCEALRREGFSGEVTLIGDEPYAPYDRPPLSKHVLNGKWEVEKTILATPELVNENKVSLILGDAAKSLDVTSKTVTLASGQTVTGSHVVIATGVRARLIPFSADEDIYALRSYGDIQRLLARVHELADGARVAVVGGGFIGAEAATALKARGFEPVVLEAAPRPLQGVLGEQVATWLEGLAKEHDIELRNNQKITDITYNGDGFSILFADAGDLDVDAVVLGVGSVANTEWLASSGLKIDNGVVVDQNLEAALGVSAIGDVARFTWRGPAGEEMVRIEHWQVANDHASQLAKYLATGSLPSEPMVPYFWSDQYAKKIQMLGHPSANDDVEIVAGSLEESKWLALYSRAGTVTGVLALSQPRALMLAKPLLEKPTSLSDARAAQPWV